MTTEVKYAIRTADGWASMSSGEQAEYAGYYTTLSAWEAALPANLVTADEQHTAVCYDDWPSGLDDAVIVDGPVTDAPQSIRVTVADGHGHGGRKDQGFYLTRTFRVNTLHTVVDGLRAVVANDVFVLGPASPTLIFRNCIAQVTASYRVGFGAAHTSNTVFPYVINCIAVGNQSSDQWGFNQTYRSGRLRARAINCLAVNCAYGFETGTGEVTNCAAYGNTVADYDAGGSTTTSASSDGTGNITGITSADFVDLSGGDYHLSSGSALRGAGTNLYSLFQTDIDGDARPSSGAWDIGPDQFVEGGANQPVSRDLTTPWHLLANAQQELYPRWSVLGAVQRDASFGWAILAALVGDADLRWRVLSRLSVDLSLAWRALQLAERDADFRWGVLAGLLAPDLDLRWSANQVAAADLTAAWDVARGVLQSADLRWDVLSEVLVASQALDLRWSMLAAAARSISMDWAVLAEVSASTEARWALMRFLHAEISAVWNTLARADGELHGHWTVLARTDTTVALRWQVLGEAGDEVLSIRLLWVPADHRVLPIPGETRFLSIH